MADRPRPPSFEQARDELADVVRRLEAGGTTLEESLALWERGEELATICQRWLDDARTRLDAARGGRAGRASRPGGGRRVAAQARSAGAERGGEGLDLGPVGLAGDDVGDAVVDPDERALALAVRRSRAGSRCGRRSWPCPSASPASVALADERRLLGRRLREADVLTLGRQVAELHHALAVAATSIRALVARQVAGSPTGASTGQSSGVARRRDHRGRVDDLRPGRGCCGSTGWKISSTTPATTSIESTMSRTVWRSRLRSRSSRSRDDRRTLDRGSGPLRPRGAAAPSSARPPRCPALGRRGVVAVVGHRHHCGRRVARHDRGHARRPGQTAEPRVAGLDHEVVRGHRRHGQRPGLEPELVAALRGHHADQPERPGLDLHLREEPVAVHPRDEPGHPVARRGERRLPGTSGGVGVRDGELGEVAALHRSSVPRSRGRRAAARRRSSAARCRR